MTGLKTDYYSGFEGEPGFSISIRPPQPSLGSFLAWDGYLSPLFAAAIHMQKDYNALPAVIRDWNECKGSFEAANPPENVADLESLCLCLAGVTSESVVESYFEGNAPDETYLNDIMVFKYDLVSFLRMALSLRATVVIENNL
jgi:hypothetical protein